MQLKLTLVFIMIISAAVLSWGINLPYAGQHDWNSVVYSNIARNHLRYGLATTKLGMVTNVGQFPQGALHYFTHYPPLMPLLLAASFFFFGVTEWAGRLVPVVSSVLMIYFLFKLVTSLWDKKTAFLTAIFLTFSPMLIYYSKIPVHETVVLGFLGATFWFYSRWLATGKNSQYWATIIALTLAQLTSWAGFYLSVFLPFHALLFSSLKATRSKRKLLLIFLLAPGLFLLHNVHMLLLAGTQAQESLLSAFLFRLNTGPQAAIFGFTYPKFLELQARWIAIYFTRVMTALAAVWIILFLKRRWQRQKINLQESFIILLLIFGFSHNILFQNLAFIHDYMLIYALPFFAVSSAVVLTKIYQALLPRFKITPFLMVVLLIMFSTERLPYLKALFHSGDTNPGYTLGKTINQITAPREGILVLSPGLMEFYDVFLNYYADRRIGVAAALSPQAITNYDYLAIPKSHDYVSPADKLFLYNNFPHRLIGDSLIFDLQKP